MRLIIRADAHSRTGTGHIMRCLALAQEWKNQHGEVTFISVCESEILSRRITDEGFQLIKITDPYIDPSEFLVPLNERPAISHNLSTQIPWVVLDGYHFNTEYQRDIKKLGYLLLVIDDLAGLDYYVADIILNQNMNAADLHYSCKSDTQLFLGTEYALLREEFLSWENWEREISIVGQKVLVTMGGSDPDNVTLKVINALNNLKDSSLEVRVVVGPSNSNIEILKDALPTAPFSISIIKNAENMAELFAWADVAVSAGGVTCWEMAFMGLPTIIIIVAENQKRVAEGLNEYGAALNLGWYSEVDEQIICDSLLNLLVNTEQKINMSKSGCKLIDGKGTKHIISKMRNLKSDDSLSIRRTRNEDAELLWVWANAADVRQNSFNSARININDHTEWLKIKLGSDTCRFWILELNNRAVGQIRYDRVNKINAEISFSISPEFRGRGLGSKLLQLTEHMAFKELGVEKLRGVTFTSNIASSRAFEKAGFINVGHEIISAHDCYIFIKKYLE